MKKVSDLKEGDFIAFGFNYHGGEPTEIQVTNITKVYEDRVLVHFLYGHHSLGEFIKNEDIIAIGNPEGETKIKGWTGKFDLLNEEKFLSLNK
jgi:hypothetical protein